MHQSHLIYSVLLKYNYIMLYYIMLLQNTLITILLWQRCNTTAHYFQVLLLAYISTST